MTKTKTSELQGAASGAACRSIVAAELADEVDVPEELA